jgi:16S rRNA processing protein RimM
MPPELLEVGRVVKAHGLAGEVVVELWSSATERLSPQSVLDSDAGPLRVLGSRPFGDRYLVRIDGVGDRMAAEALRGTVLRAAPIDGSDVLWVHELVGAEVVDREGVLLGRVAAVEPNPASDLLVLEGGALVPLCFVVEHEPGARVVVDIPDGLLE